MFLEHRAKAVASGEWVFGLVSVIEEEICYLRVNGKEEVICSVNTLGAYTSINDFLGNKIFHGDLLVSQLIENHVWMVMWNDGAWCIYRKNEKKRKYKQSSELLSSVTVDFFKFKKIGNKYDDLHLMTEYPK